MKNNVLRKLSVVFLTVCLLSAQTLVPLSAAKTAGASGKEEVVYVALRGDGSTKSVSVVNIVPGGSICDYGSYTAVRNMTTNDRLVLANGTVTGTTGAERLYYEGQLENVQIPWVISFRYYLDGAEYTAQEIAGKSGSLAIQIRIDKNDDCSGNFYDSFALLATLTLDTDNCKNIVADGATVANVGADKQLSYTIMPGKGADITVKADVKNFHMDAVTINAVRLNLAIEVDQSALTDKINELTDAIARLDDGAKELSDGVQELGENVSGDLCDGVDELAEGITKADSGTQELADGIDELNAKVKGELTDGAVDLSSGAAELADGAKSLADGALQLDGKVRGDLTDGAGALVSGASDLADGADALKTGASQLYDGIAQLDDAGGELSTGAAALQDGVVQMQTALDALNAQSSTLTDGSAQIKAALIQIQDSLSAASLSAEKIEQLVSASAEIKTGIADLLSAAETLKTNVGYAQYQAALAQQGLDVTALKSANAQMIEALSTQTATLSAQYEAICDVPGYEQQAAQIEQLSQIATLLSGSNVSIEGTETYLGSVSDGLSDLYDGAALLNEQYADFDAAIGTLAAQLRGFLTEMTELKSGIDQLVVSYSTIDSGIGEYTRGVAAIVTGYADLVDGTAELVSGTRGLSAGIAQVKDAAAVLVTGTDTLAGGAGSLLDGASTLKGAVSELSAGTGALKSGADSLSVGASAVREGAGKLTDAIGELSDGTGELSAGAADLSDGTGELLDGTDELKSGADELKDGCALLSDGTEELLDATHELRDKTDGLQQQVTDEVDDMIAQLTASDSETVSFVSDKNTNVDSVQFVITTGAIELESADDAAPVAAAELTFWQKLLKLFGLYKG